MAKRKSRRQNAGMQILSNTTPSKTGGDELVCSGRVISFYCTTVTRD